MIYSLVGTSYEVKNWILDVRTTLLPLLTRYPFRVS